jgi:hypothetical protein
VVHGGVGSTPVSSEGLVLAGDISHPLAQMGRNEGTSRQHKPPVPFVLEGGLFMSPASTDAHNPKTSVLVGDLSASQH